MAALLPYGFRLTLFGDRFSLFLATSVGLYLVALIVATRYSHRFIVGARAAYKQYEHHEDIRLRLFERLLGNAPLAEVLTLVVEY